MYNKSHHLNALKDIKQIMERSSRFISLSGLSGIAVGFCALTGAWFAATVTHDSLIVSNSEKDVTYQHKEEIPLVALFNNDLFRIAMLTFITAFLQL